MTEPLLIRALRGEPAERRPVWIMRQAGRYLPEYRELRAKRTFEEVCAEPELAAEVTLMPLRRFALDAAIVFADLVTPLAACGVPVRFAPGPVIERPLRTAADLERLRPPRDGEIAPATLEAIRLVRGALDPGVPVLGFAGAPLTTAAYLVQGRGAAGFPALAAMLGEDEPLARRLLDRLAGIAAAYLAGQVRAGASAVQVFDTWAGLLERPSWERVARPALERLLGETAGLGVPRILFVKDAPHLLDGYAALPCEALSVDHGVDLPSLRARLGPGKALQGNVDPEALVRGPDATRRAAVSLLRAMPARGHVVNLGHGIRPETPLASVQELVETVRDEAAAGTAAAE